MKPKKGSYIQFLFKLVNIDNTQLKTWPNRRKNFVFKKNGGHVMCQEQLHSKITQCGCGYKFSKMFLLIVSEFFQEKSVSSGIRLVKTRLKLQLFFLTKTFLNQASFQLSPILIAQLSFRTTTNICHFLFCSLKQTVNFANKF